MKLLTLLFILILGGVVGKKIIKGFDVMWYLLGFTIGLVIQFVEFM